MINQIFRKPNNNPSALLRLPIRVFWIIAFVILNFGSRISPISASEISLVVSPPSYDIEAKPGDTVQKSIKITNSSDKELILQAFPVDFIVQDDAGTPMKVSESASGRYLSSPWFTLNNSELVIAPGTTEQVSVIIAVPQDALPGGHYTGVFFEPVLTKGAKQTVSYTATQVGSLFEITVAGDIKYDALIKDFSVKNNVSEFGPIDFSATIENKSDTHIRPTATIEITDMIGRKLATITPDQVNIFPFAARTIHDTWETVWGFGRYTALLTVAYGPGLVATRALVFWIMPYRLLAALGVILAVIIVLFISIRRHIKHREDKRDDEIDELKRKIAEMENQQR